MQMKLYTVGCILGLSTMLCGAAEATFPRFDEVYKLLHEHVVGLTGEELDEAAVRGLLKELQSQVVLATNGTSAQEAATNLVKGAIVYDKSFAYFRLVQVAEPLADQLSTSFQTLASSNKIKGVILDLRFANGQDYAAAAATADKFLVSEQPLLSWGTTSLRSTTKESAITVPVAVLINKETRGAAEALCAALRETKVGLLLGATTAGQASVFKEFPLQNGQRLRIATAPVNTGDGKTIPRTGVKPDIDVQVSLEDERLYVEDAYKVISKPIAAARMSIETNAVASSETNQPRSRLNEAELVRRHREGLSVDDEFVEKTRRADGELRLITDPALARALDLLKGLSVVQQTRTR